MAQADSCLESWVLGLAVLRLWEGFGGGFEEEVEEIAAFAEETAQDFGDGEDELAVGAEGGTVFFLVGGEEGFPGGREDLPEW